MIYILLFLFLLLLLLVMLGFYISGLLLYPRRQPLTRNPADYGLEYEKVSFESADGLSLRGWWIPAVHVSEPEGQAPVVILLHPMLGNRHGFQPRPTALPRLLRTEVDLLASARSFHQIGCSVLMFDFRSHGESQSGMCAGGLAEDQDVAGAVDYVFSRLAALAPAVAPQVGLVGFGLGGCAAIAAVGREKGGAETIRVFTGDSEGGIGWAEILPANVKKLRFLVAVQPVSLRALLRGYLRQVAPLLDLVLVPLVNRIFLWRGGYPLDGALLLKVVRQVNVPVLFVAASRDFRSGLSEAFASGEVPRLYEATCGPKQIWLIDALLNPFEVYAYAGKNLQHILNFAGEHVSRQPVPSTI